LGFSLLNHQKVLGYHKGPLISDLINYWHMITREWSWCWKRYRKICTS